MYPVHKTLARSELEAAARRIPCLKLLPALSPYDNMDLSWDEEGALTVAPGLAMTEGDFDEVADLG